MYNLQAPACVLKTFLWHFVYLRCLGYKEKMIILQTTDAVNSLTYKIDGYAYMGGVPDPVIEATALATTDVISYVLLDPYAQVEVSVVDSVPASHATYRVDYAMS
jgi:hypothetical protein